MGGREAVKEPQSLGRQPVIVSVVDQRRYSVVAGGFGTCPHVGREPPREWGGRR